ncbi:DUF4328 domain-containing protein [Streptomyces sp. NPDC059909]|uniref:DUF4328 domain-containing protein n=1 Tax=Streptomyces sp. NPDC059909 TaxID=3346998 RepID=UPI00365E3603
MSSARPPVTGPVLRAPVGLSYAVVALLGLVVLVDLVWIYAAALMRGLMGDVAEGDLSAYGDEGLDRAQLLLNLNPGFSAVAFLVTAIVFILWFHRARINAGVFGPDLQRRGPGWAVGSWFIPIANLWIPYGVAADVWDASDRDLGTPGRRTSRAVLNAWWAAWLGSWAVDRIATGVDNHAEDAAEIHEAMGLLILSNAADIAAAVLAILFVRKLTAMQHAKALQGRTVATV